jgi:hypothetical protein
VILRKIEADNSNSMLIRDTNINSHEEFKGENRQESYGRANTGPSDLFQVRGVSSRIGVQVT